MNERDLKRPWIVALVTGATFFYFLIFAQFGYLHLLGTIDPDGKLIDSAMLAMGIAGILGCVLTAWKFRIENARTWILSGFSGSALAAAISPFVSTFWIQVTLALSVGFFLGVLTVSIVPAIRALAPVGKVGRWVGLGTGGAYFLSNVPVVFNASPVHQCLVGAAACGIGMIAAITIPDSPRGVLESGSRDETYAGELFKTKGILVVAALFLGLIWLDSAAFYIVQDSGALKSLSWGNGSQLWANAATHLVVAVAAGWILDRGFLSSILILSFVALMAGYHLLTGNDGLARTGALVYVAGVSLYSTALVAYGALAGEDRDTWTVVRRAGMVFALGGWFGSAMGIGMARDLGRIPVPFVIALACALCGAVWFRSMSLGKPGGVT